MKFKCVCGNVLRDQTFPNPIGLRLIHDQQFDEITSMSTIDAKELWRRSSRALQCDVCGRIYIFPGGRFPEWPPQEFVPVKPDVENCIDGSKE